MNIDEFTAVILNDIIDDQFDVVVLEIKSVV